MGARCGAVAAVVALAVVMSCGSAQQVPQYRMQTWQSDSGLPQNTVHAVVQTRDGFLWLATEGGLVRFDGVNFKVWDAANTPEFRSDLVDGLVEDRAGALWVATSDGLLRMSGGQFRAFHVADGLPSDVVTGVYRQDGRVVAATAGGLAVQSGERLVTIAGSAVVGEAAEVHVLPADAQGTLWASAGQRLLAVRAGSVEADGPLSAGVGTIHALAATRDGAVWVGGAGGLRCWRGRQACAGRDGIEPALLLSREDVTALAVSPDGALWVGTAAGLWEIKDGMRAVPDRSGVLRGVQRLFVDSEGAVWAGFERGVGRVVGGTVAMVAPLSGSDQVLAMMEDSEGDLWLGSEANGLSVLRDQPFTTLTTQQGLSADYVRTVFQNRAGVVLVGTDKGGLDQVVRAKGQANGWQAGPVRAQGEIASSVVLALAETGEGVWVGTPDGLTRLRAGRAKTFTGEDGLPDSFVRSLFGDQDGTLWIGTRNGLARETGGKFSALTTANGLGSNVIGSVLRTRDGVLWVGTLAGLSRLEGSGFRNFSEKDGLRGDAVTVLFEDSRGDLWIGTNGTGLTRFRAGRFAGVDSARAGLPQTVYGMVEDGSGHLWMSSKDGIYRVRTAALNAFADGATEALPVERFGAADGMRIGESSGGGHPAAWRMRDGTLWFATIRGVAWVDPRSVRDREPPRVVVERILLDGREAAQASAGMVVPAGRERIAFDYAGLSFAAPAKVRYRYRLEGFDRGWVEAGGARTALYTNVPPGRYRFAVEASAADGVWSAVPAEVNLRVQPQFFETWWFDTLLAAGLLLLGYGLYRLRVRFVEARLNGVMAERGRIAREIHDTLAQGYVGISVQLEIVSQLLGVPESRGADAAREQLEETKALVRSGLAEARSSIWELRREGAGDAGSLPARIAELRKSKRRAGDTEVVVQVHGAYRALPGEVEDEVLRIAQEAVANARRHAGSSARVAVSLSYDAAGLEMRVTDDGEGFEEQRVDSLGSRGHFGLQGMRERAAAIAAELTVTSAVGRGTTVRLRVQAEKES